MRILSIALKNFRAHADSFVAFPPEGICGIIGSNESGKSSLATEALLFALYGAAAIRGTKGGLRWHRAPARHVASVDLRFEIGGRVYRLERTEGGAKLWQGALCIADGTSAVNKHVPGLLGMTLQDFTSSFLVLQKDVARIAGMLPTERLAFVRGVLGVGKIDVGIKAIRKRKAELADELRGLSAGLGEREPHIGAVIQYRTAVTEAAGLAAQWTGRHGAATVERDRTRDALHLSEARKAKHDQMVRRHEDATTALMAAKREMDRLELVLGAQQAAAGRVATIEPQLAALDRLRGEVAGMAEAKAQATLYETWTMRSWALSAGLDGDDGVRDRLVDAERRVAEFVPAAMAAADVALRAAATNLDGLRAERLRTADRHRHMAETAAAAADRLAEQARTLHAIGADAPCPTCTRKLADQFDGVVRSLREAARLQANMAADARAAAGSFAEPDDDELAAEVVHDEALACAASFAWRQQDATQAWEQVIWLRVQEAKAVAELATIEANLQRASAVQYDFAQHLALMSEVARLEKLDRALSADRGAASQTQATAALHEEQYQATVTREHEIAGATGAIAEIAFDPQAHARTVQEAEDARRGAEDARVALARAQQAEEGSRGMLASSERALAAYDERAVRLTAVRAEHLTHERTDARLTEFRVAIAGTIRPELEELVAAFVAILTDGRHEGATITEDFDVILYESGVPVEVVSGGTEDVAALAMRLAISQLITQRAGHDLGLLVLDEVFTALDHDRQANVLTLLRRLRGVFPQILLISHIAATRDAVDHAIELEFSEADGCTRVTSAPLVVTPNVTVGDAAA